MDTKKCGITTKPEGVIMSKKKVYTEEFKKQAVELSFELQNVAEASRQLGIRDMVLHKWRSKYKPEKKSAVALESDEIKRLKRENEELKKVNYILKRAAAFFSQDHLK